MVKLRLEALGLRCEVIRADGRASAFIKLLLTQPAWEPALPMAAQVVSGSCG